MTLKTFVKKRPYLFWYTRNYNSLSSEAVVEAVLNYGDFDDVKKLFAILGIKRAAKIFSKQTGQKRVNYSPQVINYFKRYFNKYA